YPSIIGGKRKGRVADHPFLICGNPDSLREPNAMYEILKSRLGPKRVESGLNILIHERTATLRKCLLHPNESSVFFSKPQVDPCNVEGRNWAHRRSCLSQLLENVPGAL